MKQNNLYCKAYKKCQYVRNYKIRIEQNLLYVFMLFQLLFQQ